MQNTNASKTKQDIRELLLAIVELDSIEEARAFFEDLCTPGEIKAMADRWKAVRLLQKGIPYREIYEQTGISTATVTRVARALETGAGGYQAALERLNQSRTPGRRA